MGMTMTQKILAAHAGLDHVEAGQLIEVNLDMVLEMISHHQSLSRNLKNMALHRYLIPGKSAW